MPNDKGPSRKKRLESLLHREVAVCVQQQLRDPRLGFITVIRVEMSDDLHQVTAFYTVLGDASQRRLAAKALEHARGFVQNSYASVVKTRTLPMLSFKYDDAEDKRQSMNDLIRKARSTDPDSGLIPSPDAASHPQVNELPTPEAEREKPNL